MAIIENIDGKTVVKEEEQEDRRACFKDNGMADQEADARRQPMIEKAISPKTRAGIFSMLKNAARVKGEEDE